MANLRHTNQLAALTLVFAATVLAADLNNPDVQAKLARGEIVVELAKEPGTHTLVGTATGVVDAPLEQVWAVLGDYNHFAEFMPRFKACFMLKPEALTKIGDARDLHKVEPTLRACLQDSLISDTLLLYHCLDFPFPVGDRRDILRAVRDRINYRTHYTQVMGDMKVNEGGWDLLPYGDKTLAIYTTRSDVGTPIPGFLLSLGTRSILPDVIKGVRKRVKELFPTKD